MQDLKKTFNECRKTNYFLRWTRSYHKTFKKSCLNIFPDALTSPTDVIKEFHATKTAFWAYPIETKAYLLKSSQNFTFFKWQVQFDSSLFQLVCVQSSDFNSIGKHTMNFQFLCTFDSCWRCNVFSELKQEHKRINFISRKISDATFCLLALTQWKEITFQVTRVNRVEKREISEKS